MTKLLVKEFDIIEYEKTLAQMQHFTKNRDTLSYDEIWFLQHYPVFTLGYNGERNHLIKESSIPIVKSDRGGNITYHGPGQIIGYILIDLKRKKLNVYDLVKATENIIIDTLGNYQVEAHTIKNAPGIYINNQKICSLGFRIKNGCSYHGFAFNIDMDLTPFHNINPCGYKNMIITQLKEHVQNTSIPNVIEYILVNFEKYLGYTDIEIKNN